MVKIIKFLLFFILIFVFSINKVQANSNFTTDYNVTYTINNNSNTHVLIKGDLKNLSDKFAVSSYNITLGFKNLKNIKASDSQGLIKPKVTTNQNGTKIILEFNKQIAGINNILSFQISFDTTEISQNLNNSWNINIPGISSENNFSSFNVTVNYPTFLGNPTYIKPNLLNKTEKIGELIFTKENLGSSGISIAFGNFQIYKFNLKYHLENKNIFTALTEIALPPDTGYQKIILDNINPKPINVIQDQDGNWLAQFKIPGSKKLDVSVTGKVKIFLTPNKEELSLEAKDMYLNQQPFWQIKDKKIVELSKKLKTPKEIYEYVVKNLNYDFSRVESKSPRLGAAYVVNNPSSAVCLEFTDLFIALSRAAGIPAREVDGFGFSNNTSQRPQSYIQDILHTWPEYYDFEKQAWIMVDPTWGNTTGGVDYFNLMDFNHIAFVIKGVSSNYPIPAGGYKTSSNKNIKDINISIDSSFNELSKFEINNNSLQSQIAGLPISSEIKIINKGNIMLKKQNAKVNATILNPKTKVLTINNIPPYGFQTIKINYNSVSFLTKLTDTIKITVGNSSFSLNLIVNPFYLNQYIVFGGILFASICIFLSIAAYIYRRL